MRPIDADALLAQIPEPDTLTNHVTLTRTAVDQFRQLVEQAPTVDPVKHGHWIGVEDVECSVCGECYYYTEEMSGAFAELYHYCPNCGAKMDGGGDEIKSGGEADGTG